MDEDTATRRARAHIEWGWTEQEVLRDLIGGGCDPDLARRLVADAGSDRDASTRIKGVIDLVLGGIAMILAVAAAWYLFTRNPVGVPMVSARGAGWLVVIPLVCGFGGIFLSVRGIWRTLFASE